METPILYREFFAPEFREGAQDFGMMIRPHGEARKGDL
jgi:hypothetical protein